MMTLYRFRRDRIARNAHAWKLTIGETLIEDLSRRKWNNATERTDSIFFQFIHALNTSDWLTAAYILQSGGSITLEKARSSSNLLLAFMVKQSLEPLFYAADRFHRDRVEWQGDLQQAYQFGTLPVYGPRIVDGRSVTSSYADDADVVEHGRNLTRLIPTFQEYEKINQRYQKPAYTQTGATIHFTQGHNWTFAHARKELLDKNTFSREQRRILVNWDAHRDLSSPFGHLSREMSLLMQWMQIDRDRLLRLVRHAKTPEEISEVTSMISIAGWILPLLYVQQFSDEYLSEIVLVVPREAMKTSREDYWPDYGSYTMDVGHAAIDDDEIDKIHQQLNQNLPSNASSESFTKSSSSLPSIFFEQIKTLQNNGAFKSIQSISSHPSFQTVSEEMSAILQNAHNVKVHIVDPDDPDTIDRILNGAELYLSVDVDFAGTNHLGGWYSDTNPVPHYPLNETPEEEARHKQLIERFEAFFRRNSGTIKGVSVANSPDYTADEARRRPAARILEILTTGATGEQPDWVSAESSRSIPDPLQNHPSRHLLMSLAGILGISITAALIWHYSRCNQIKRDRLDTDTEARED